MRRGMAWAALFRGGVGQRTAPAGAPPPLAGPHPRRRNPAGPGTARMLRAAPSLAAAALLLAGCTAQPVRAPAPAAADPARAQAEARQRAGLRDWTLAGRIAASNGRQGGSGRIDWRQRGAAYSISVSAPVTRQSWRLSGDAAGARLEGLEGGPRESADVEALLYQATGWNVPVRALADWVRGIGAPALGPAELAYGADGLPARLRQDGWTIDYRDWRPVAGGPVLPGRVEAVRGEAKVRLVVDAWTLGEGE